MRSTIFSVRSGSHRSLEPPSSFEAEAVVVSETKTLLAQLRDLAADCAGEARDLGRHLAAADALCSLATVALERDWICPTVNIGTVILLPMPLLKSLSFETHETREHSDHH